MRSALVVVLAAAAATRTALAQCVVTGPDPAEKELNEYWSGGSVIGSNALGTAEDQFQFNSIGNHIVELQDGTNLVVDAANHRMKILGKLSDAVSERYPVTHIAGNGETTRSNAFPQTTGDARNAPIGDVLGLAADTRPIRNASLDVYFTERGTGSIRRLFKQAGGLWTVSTLFSSQGRASNTHVACEVKVVEMPADSGIPACNISSFDFHEANGGPSTAKLFSTPTALIHDPTLNALFFFDGPFLRMLELKVTGEPWSRQVTAGQMRTLSIDDPDQEDYQPYEPVNINYGLDPIDFAPFSPADGTAASPYVVTVTPFVGYSMAWAPNMDLIFLDPLCGLIRRMALDRTMPQVQAVELVTEMGDPSNCTLLTYADARAIQKDLALPLSDMGPVFEDIAPFIIPQEAQASFRPSLALIPVNHTWPMHVGPAGIGSVGFSRYIMAMPLEANFTIDSVGVCDRSSLQAQTYLLAGANTFSITRQFATNYNELDPTAIRIDAPTSPAGDPARTRLLVWDFVQDNSSGPVFTSHSYVSAVFQEDQLLSGGPDQSMTAHFTVDGLTIPGAFVLGMAANGEGDIMFVNVGATPTTDFAAAAVESGIASSTSSYGSGDQCSGDGCPPHWVGDGICDYCCFILACSNDDGGDCALGDPSSMTCDPLYSQRRLLGEAGSDARWADKRQTWADAAFAEAARKEAEAGRELQFTLTTSAEESQYDGFNRIPVTADFVYPWGAAVGATRNDAVTTPFVGSLAPPTGLLTGNDFNTLAAAVSHPLALLAREGKRQLFFPNEAVQVSARVDRWRPIRKGDSWAELDDLTPAEASSAFIEHTGRSRYQTALIGDQLWFVGGNEEAADADIAGRYLRMADQVRFEASFFRLPDRPLPYAGNSLASTFYYEISTETWHSGPDLNEAREDFVLVSDDTALYAIGGVRHVATRTNRSRLYDDNGVFPLYPPGSTMFGSPDRVEIIRTESTFVHTIEKLEPGGSWQTLPLELPFGRDRMGGAMLGSKVFLVGGRKQCPLDPAMGGLLTDHPRFSDIMSARMPLPETPLEAYNANVSDVHTYQFNYGEIFSPTAKQQVLGQGWYSFMVEQGLTFEFPNGTNFLSSSYYSYGPGPSPPPIPGGGGGGGGGGGAGGSNPFDGFCAPFNCSDFAPPGSEVEECSPGCCSGYEFDTFVDPLCMTPECNFDSCSDLGGTGAFTQTCLDRVGEAYCPAGPAGGSGGGMQRMLRGSGAKAEPKQRLSPMTAAARQLFQKEAGLGETFRSASFFTSDDFNDFSDAGGYSELFFAPWKKTTPTATEWEPAPTDDSATYEFPLKKLFTSSSAKQVPGLFSTTNTEQEALPEFPCLDDLDRPYSSVDVIDLEELSIQQLASRLKVPLVRPAVATTTGMLYATGGVRLDLSRPAGPAYAMGDATAAVQAMYALDLESEWRVLNMKPEDERIGNAIPFTSFNEVSEGLGGASLTPRTSMVATAGRLFTAFETFKLPIRGDLSTLPMVPAWEPTSEFGFIGWGQRVHVVAGNGGLLAISERPRNTQLVREKWKQNTISYFLPLAEPVVVEDIVPRLADPAGGTEVFVFFSVSTRDLDLDGALSLPLMVNISVAGVEANVTEVGVLVYPQFVASVIVPAGVGANVTTTVTLANGKAGEFGLLSYEAPQIYSLDVQSGPTTGDFPITIFGKGFSSPARAAGKTLVTFERPDHPRCTKITVLPTSVTLLNDTTMRIRAPAGVGYGWIPRIEIAGQRDTTGTEFVTNADLFVPFDSNIANPATLQSRNLRPSYVFDYNPPKVFKVSNISDLMPTVGGGLIRIEASNLGPIAFSEANPRCGYVPTRRDRFSRPRAGVITPTTVAQLSMREDTVVLKHPAFKPQVCEGGPKFRVKVTQNGVTSVLDALPSNFNAKIHSAVSVVDCVLPPGAGFNWTVSMVVDGQRDVDYDVDVVPRPNPNRVFKYDNPEVYVVIPVTPGPITGGSVLTVRGVNFGLRTYDNATVANRDFDPYIRRDTNPWETPIAVDSDALAITIAGHSVWVLDWLSDTFLRITAPAGVGASQVVKVCLFGQCSVGAPDPNALNVFAYVKPEVGAIQPSTVLKGTFVDTRTFTIVGLNFGLSQENVTAVSLAGASCLSYAWINQTAVECRGVDGNAMTSSGRAAPVEVEVNGQTNVPAGVLHVIAQPGVTSVTPGRGSAGDTVRVSGEDWFRDGVDTTDPIANDLVSVQIGGVNAPIIPNSLERQPNGLSSVAVRVPPAGTQLTGLPVAVVNRAGARGERPNLFDYAGSGDPPVPPVGFIALSQYAVDKPDRRVTRFAWYHKWDKNNPPVLVKLSYADSQASLSALNSRRLQSEGANTTSNSISIPFVSGNPDFLIAVAASELEADSGLVGPRPRAIGPRQGADPAKHYIPQEVADFLAGADEDGCQGNLCYNRFRWEDDTIPDDKPYFFNIQAQNDVGLSPIPAVNGTMGPVFAGCSNEEYLATEAPTLPEVVCKPCPTGALCQGRPAQRVVVRAGYWRAPWDPMEFVRCDEDTACEGWTAGEAPSKYFITPNSYPSLARGARYVGENPSLLTNIDVNGTVTEVSPVEASSPTVFGNAVANGDASSSCAEGYTGTLCNRCEVGYARSGEAGCGKCRSDGSNGVALFGGAVLGLIVVFAMTFMTLNSKGKPGKTYVAIVKVFMTHMQTVGIAAGFPLRWPSFVFQFMQGMNTATSVSDNLLSPDCVAGKSQVASDFDGSTFYMRAVVMIVLPWLLIAFFGVFWYFHWACGCPLCWEDGGMDDARRWVGLKPKAAAAQPAEAEEREGAPSGTKSKKATVAVQPSDEAEESKASVKSGRSSEEVTVAAGASAAGAAATTDDTASAPAASAPPLPQIKDVKGSDDDAEFAMANPIERGTSKGSARPGSARPSSRSSMAEPDWDVSGTKFENKRKSVFEALDLASLAKSHHVDYFIVSIIVMAFLIHPNLTRVTLSMFTCVQLPGTDSTFLVQDKAVECNTAESIPWMYGLGLPTFILYAIGIPALAFFALRRKRDTLESSALTRATYGFLYSSFNVERYYWEEVIMLRKVGFAMMAVLLAPLGIISQTMLATLVLTLFAVVHARSMPYNRPVLNRLEMYSLIISLFTLQGGLYLFACDVCSDVTQQAITVLIVLINVGFMIAVIVALLAALGAAESSTDKKGIRGGIAVVVASTASCCLGLEKEEGGGGEGEDA